MSHIYRVSAGPDKKQRCGIRYLNSGLTWFQNSGAMNSAAKWCRVRRQMTKAVGRKVTWKEQENSGRDFCLENHDVSMHFPCSTVCVCTFKIFPVTLGSFVWMKPLMSLLLGIATWCKPDETDAMVAWPAGLETEIHDMETTARCKSLSHGLGSNLNINKNK